MPPIVKQIGKMNLDKGWAPGDHAWAIKNLLLTENGYELMPEEDALATFGDGTTPKGAHHWSGGQTARSYIALLTSIYEYDHGSTFTDVTGTALTNATNGVTFASYGEFCFASNGVDPIQSIRVPSSTGSSSVNFLAMDYTDDGAQIAPKYICSHKNHLIGVNAKMLASYSELGTYTTGVGAAFTNQPAGDSVQVLSLVNSANTRSRSATIYGTRVGQGDTVSYETIALNAANSTTPVTTVITNWALILAVKIDAAADQIIRFRETSGAATIVDIAVGPTSAGVEQPSPAVPAGGQTVTIVADGATTRQIGLTASDWSGGVVYDSQALTNDTAVQSNERMTTVLEIFTGDLEVTRTVTITTFEFAIGSEHPYAVWISATDVPESFGKITINPTFTGVELLQLFDGVGKTTGVIDGGDCFFVFKEGSVHRIDGPPFVPTVISYSIGMPAGCTPYRQADRIYFWAISGLHFIDINTNQITNLFSGVMQRSVSDYANINFGVVVGTFPKLTGTTSIELENVVPTGNTVNISGDSRYGYVLLSFANGSLGFGSLLYQSKEDAFVIPGTVDPFAGVLWEVPQAATGAPFPMSAIRKVTDTGTSNTVWRWVISELHGRDLDFRPYVALPYDRFDASGARGRVVRVRPIFDSSATVTHTPTDYSNSHVRVLSISGYGKTWPASTPTVSDASSKDGWFHVNGCPNADKHSVAVAITEVSSSQTTIVGLSAIEVEYALEGGSRTK